MESNILLIHGAYHGAWCWEKVKSFLEKRGVSVYAIDLPGHGNDYTDRHKVDINGYVSKLETFIIDNNLNNIILVGHSFGGVVISKLIERISERVIKIVFVSAVILDDGENFFDYFSEALKEKYLRQAEESLDNSVSPNAESLRARLFNDLKDDHEFNKIFKQLTPQPITPYTEKIYLKNFKDISIPIYYVYCKNDISLPKEAFDKILSKLPAGFQRIDIDSDHEIMFSHPNELAEILINLI